MKNISDDEPPLRTFKQKPPANAFLRIHNTAFDNFALLLGADGWLLYCYLCRKQFSEEVRNVSTPSVISKTGIGRTRLFELLNELEGYRLIRRRQISGKTTVYQLLDIERAVRHLRELQYQESVQRRLANRNAIATEISTSGVFNV